MSVNQFKGFDFIFVLKYNSIPSLNELYDIFNILQEKTADLPIFYLIADVLAFREKPSREIREYVKKRLNFLKNLIYVTYITDIPEIFSIVPQFVLSTTNIKEFSVSIDYEDALKKILEFQKLNKLF